MFDTISIFINLIEKIIELIEGKKTRDRVLGTPLSETLEKVERAQEHLTEAIESIDVIRNEVVQEKQKLDNLIDEVEDKKTQYAEASNELKTTKDLLDQDQDQLRSALGMNSPREKLIGFFSGVIASILATALWLGGSTLYERLAEKPGEVEVNEQTPTDDV